MRLHWLAFAAAALASPLPASMEPPDADATQRQAEASVEQVEADLKRMATFSSEVRRSLDEADRAKIDVQHALGYFRRQTELQQDERDAAKTKVLRVEEEVATLQRRIQALEAENKAVRCLPQYRTCRVRAQALSSAQRAPPSRGR